MHEEGEWLALLTYVTNRGMRVGNEIRLPIMQSLISL